MIQNISFELKYFHIWFRCEPDLTAASWVDFTGASQVGVPRYPSPPFVSLIVHLCLAHKNTRLSTQSTSGDPPKSIVNECPDFQDLAAVPVDPA